VCKKGLPPTSSHKCVILSPDCGLLCEARARGEGIQSQTTNNDWRRKALLLFFPFFSFFWVCLSTRDVPRGYDEQIGRWRLLFAPLVGRGSQVDGADGTDGRAMPGPRSWMAFIGTDTQSGQINFTARRNNVIGGVRL
jgi:hypothetical protein